MGAGLGGRDSVLPCPCSEPGSISLRGAWVRVGLEHMKILRWVCFLNHHLAQAGIRAGGRGEGGEAGGGRRGEGRGRGERQREWGAAGEKREAGLCSRKARAPGDGAAFQGLKDLRGGRKVILGGSWSVGKPEAVIAGFELSRMVTFAAGLSSSL